MAFHTPGVDTRIDRTETALVRYQVVHCHACPETTDIRVVKCDKTDVFLAKIIRARGWKADIKKGKHVCPNCQKGH